MLSAMSKALFGKISISIIKAVNNELEGATMAFTRSEEQMITRLIKTEERKLRLWNGWPNLSILHCSR